MDRQRLDKWLWHARVVKTRTDAAAFLPLGSGLNEAAFTRARRTDWSGIAIVLITLAAIGLIAWAAA